MAIGQHINYGQPVNRAHPLCRDLVAWWKVLPSWSGGGQLWDLCGRYHGTLTNGPTWAGALGRPGAFGAVSFDGTDDYAGATASALSRPCTVLMWYRPITNIGTGNQWLFTHDAAANNGWRVARAGTAPESLRLTFGGIADYTFTTLSMGSENTWYFLAVTVPVNSGTAVGYLSSGGPITEESQSVGTMSGTPTQFTVGGLSWFSGSADGRIDDVMLFGRALSSSEVSGIYRETQRPDNPMLNWIRPVRVISVAAPGGRTTRNTRAFPLGVAIGMDFGHCNI